MPVELAVDVQYANAGHKRITIKDVRDTYREILAKAKEDEVNADFFKQIVRAMPGLIRMAQQRVSDKYSHYFEGTDTDSSEGAVLIWMKEIASMDPSLERRITKKSLEMLGSFAELANLQTVNVGLNTEKQYVVKLVYTTPFKPDDLSLNEYDEEKQLRVTFSEPFSDKQRALNMSLWLAGALNVRQIDEDDLP